MATVIARLAAVSTTVAGLVWLLGLPLTVLAAPVPGSDLPFALMGAIGVLLGLTLMPGVVAQFARVPRASNAGLWGVGIGVCGIEACTAALLSLAVTGTFGQRAPRWIEAASDLALLALLLWILLTSVTTRDPSGLGRATFWLGSAVGLSALALTAVVTTTSTLNVVFTNATIVPLLAIGVLLWLSPTAWFLVLAVRVWMGGAGSPPVVTPQAGT